MVEPVQYFVPSGSVLVGRARELERVIGISNDTTITKPELWHERKARHARIRTAFPAKRQLTRKVPGTYALRVLK
jgi:hypothetical protein